MAAAGRLPALLLALALFMLPRAAWAFSAEGPLTFGGPPVQTLFPDDIPAPVTFQFPGGGAAERFTGNRDAWYSLFRLGMMRGISYNLILSHEGDKDRLKLFALDNHPFAQVRMRHELKLVEKGSFRVREGTQHTYQVAVTLPDEVAAAEIYLLLEWVPRFDRNGPLPVSLQVVTFSPLQRPAGSRFSFFSPGPPPYAADQGPRPVTLPLRKP